MEDLNVYSDQIIEVAAEVFVALIDQEPGFLNPWQGDPTAVPAAPLYSWVNAGGGMAARALIETEVETANDLARALLGMNPDEEVSEADLVDAFGEVANVVGGNLKSLLPDPGKLTLPQVSRELPGGAGDMIISAKMDWKGKLIIVSIYQMPDLEGE